MIMLMEDGSAVSVAYSEQSGADVAAWVSARYEPQGLVDALVEHWGLEAVRAALPPEEAEEPLKLSRFSQRDPRWRNIPLGYSDNHTLGTAGCAVTACAMIASQVDPEITPETLNGLLQDGGGFWGGDLIWDKVALAVTGLEWAKRDDWNVPLHKVELEEVRAYLDRYGPVVMEVDYKPETSKQEQHFVVALEMTDDDVRILDPWDGAETWLMRRYAEEDHDLARAIWGVRVYSVGG